MILIPEKDILSLRKILETVPEESLISADLSTFKCSVDPDIQEFLAKRSIPFEKAHKSRTYLIVLTEMSNPGEMDILGYFTVAMDHYLLRKGMSKSLRRRLNGIFNDDRIPCFLIGQLVGNDSCSKEELSGHELIEDALNVLLKAHELIGGRFLLVECKEHEALLSFYQQNGFIILPGKEGEYCQLVKFVQADTE